MNSEKQTSNGSQCCEGLLKVEAELVRFSRETKASFKNVDQRFEKMDASFAGINQRFEKMDASFGSIYEKIHFQDLRAEEFDRKLDRVLDVVIDTNRRLVLWDSLRDNVINHEHRITALEHQVGGSKK